MPYLRLRLKAEEFFLLAGLLTDIILTVQIVTNSWAASAIGFAPSRKICRQRSLLLVGENCFVRVVEKRLSIKARKVEVMFVPRRLLEQKLVALLAEDIGQGDITAAVIAPAGLAAQAEVVAKAEGTIAGMEEAAVLAEALGLKVKCEVSDGQEAKVDQRLMLLSGDARTILTVERTMLNLLSRMSGIATATKKLTAKIQKANLQTRIAATRKTALGFMYFDKKAVIIGGGDAHRLHLDDMALIKDNHLVLAGSIENALKLAKEAVSFSKKIEVEVSKPADALKAAQLGADIVMLDNFSPKQTKEAIALLKKSGFFGKMLVEASGGITEENLLDYAAAEVDLISLGALTHSVKALDISLDVIAPKQTD